MAKTVNKEPSNLGFLLHLASRRRALMITAIACSILSGLATFVPYVMVAQSILILFDAEINSAEILAYGLIAVGAIALRFILSGISALCTHKAAYETLYQVRRDLCAHLGDIHLGFFTHSSLGETRKVLMEDVERLEEFLAHQIPDIVVAAVVPTVACIYLFTLNVQMTLMLFVPIVITTIAQVVLLKVSKEGMGAFYATAARMSSVIMQFINGMPVMKSFNLTTGSYKQYAQATQDYNAAWWSVARYASTISAACSVIVESGIAFMIPLGGLLFLRGDLVLGEYVFFIIMSIVFLSSYSNLMNFAQLYSQIEAGVQRIRHMLGRKVQTWGDQALRPEDDAKVCFEDVTFSYEESDIGVGREVLSDIDLTLAPKTLTAFVGASGAGKSTAAQLIPRFWDVDHGRITINGRAIGDYSRSSLMDAVSFVFQDAFMLDDTIYENIAIGSTHATTKAVEEAAKAAQIHSFIASLPDGYQTHLGDKGIKLSGGERQRICIARAILKDAPLIIFDEATSFTDMENERKIQRALGNLLAGKTTIMVAHRLHTIVNADEICIFENGRIIERGTHQELLDAEGTYAHMWSMYGKVV